MDEQQQDQERPPDVTCSGGFALPSIAVLIGRQPEREQDIE